MITQAQAKDIEELIKDAKSILLRSALYNIHPNNYHPEKFVEILRQLRKKYYDLSILITKNLSRYMTAKTDVDNILEKTRYIIDHASTGIETAVLLGALCDLVECTNRTPETEPLLSRIRNKGSLLKKIFVGIGIATTLAAAPKNVSTENIKKPVPVEIKVNTSQKDLLPPGVPQPPPGYRYVKTVNAIVTAYTPTGPGLKANGMKETGLTSTGKNAFTTEGVAVDPNEKDLAHIHYGSLVYIDGKFFEANDTGGMMREDGKHGKYHIDERVQDEKQALAIGKSNRLVHIYEKI